MMTPRHLALIAMMLLAAAPAALAQGSEKPFVIEGRKQGYATLSEAVDAIGDGTGTILIAPGTYADCAVQASGEVIYRAVEPGSVIFDGHVCEGKAVLVLRGRSAQVDGITFQNLAVPDGNGAGIRLEKGDLVISRSIFRDSQEGLLTASDPDGSVSIVQSTFSHLGRCGGNADCAHSVSVGDYASLSILRSRFEAGTGGHYVKSRARRVDIIESSFDDSDGHATSYMIDLPNGAVGQITGNEMVQGADNDNASAFIALGAEGAKQPSDGLVVRGNGAGFVPGLSRRSVLVADWANARLVVDGNNLAPGLTPYERRSR